MLSKLEQTLNEEKAKGRIESVEDAIDTTKTIDTFISGTTPLYAGRKLKKVQDTDYGVQENIQIDRNAGMNIKSYQNFGKKSYSEKLHAEDHGTHHANSQQIYKIEIPYGDT